MHAGARKHGLDACAARPWMHAPAEVIRGYSEHPSCMNVIHSYVYGYVVRQLYVGVHRPEMEPQDKNCRRRWLDYQKP